MNDPNAIAADAVAFRQAVEQGLPYKPLYIKVKIVWNCNLRCGMCNHWREQVEPQLGVDFFERLVDDLAELGCQKLHLTGGEPTLRSNLEDVIARANNYGIRVTMTSNATLITEERAYTLVKAGLQKINISIDSPDRAIHDQIRGVPGGWERATQGFRYLRRYLKPGRMRINTVIGQLNYASLVTLPDLAAELGADRLNLIPMDEHTADLQRLNQRQIAHYNRCIAPVIARKALKLGLIQQEQDAYPFGRVSRDTAHSLHGHYARGYYNQHPCFAPWTHALIDHVGRVSLCCMMPNKPVIGDLRQQSFKEIWQGEAFASLRRTRHLPQFEACTHCDMFLKENQQLATLLA